VLAIFPHTFRFANAFPDQLTDSAINLLALRFAQPQGVEDDVVQRLAVGQRLGLLLGDGDVGFRVNAAFGKDILYYFDNVTLAR